jgi:hypothetical protein
VEKLKYFKLIIAVNRGGIGVVLASEEYFNVGRTPRPDVEQVEVAVIIFPVHSNFYTI